MKTLIKRLAHRSSVWQKALKLLRESSPKQSVLVAGLALAEAASGIAVLYLVKRVVDTISDDPRLLEGAGETGQLFILLGLIGVAMVFVVALQRLTEYVRQRLGLEVADYVDRMVHDRAIAVDLGFYESPRYFDSLARARAAGSERPAQVIGTFTQLLRSLVYLGGVGVLMVAIDWRLIFVIFLGTAAAMVVRLYFTRLLFDWRYRRAQLQRRAGYLDWLLTSDVHAKELRIGQLGATLRDRYSTLRREIRGEEIAIERRRLVAEVGAATIAAIVFFGVTVWLVLGVVGGKVSLGDLVLFLLLFRRAEVSGREFVSATSGMYDHRLYLSQLFDFLSVEPDLIAPSQPVTVPVPVRQGVRFHNVSFRYPSNRELALANIDFELAAGKVTAIVGENGSGKTSLIKLLCRLYDPDEGKITLDGIDIRQFDPASYRQLFSVIFQDYSRYAETVSENIRFGDVAAKLDDPRIAYAAKLGGAVDFIADLPKGLATPLTRLFDDGRELSLGQWQRVALSRAFFPHSQFIIMDEPTSAVDPRAEAELFDNFKERLEGRAALVISHRLSTIRMADVIYMLGNGRVLEAGTHDELVAAGGRYAALFSRQARAFLDPVGDKPA
ncbi:MAG: ABC transporter ATP-binding protein [Erythrobacter sp.]